MRALAESGFLEEGVGSILSLNSLLRQWEANNRTNRFIQQSGRAGPAKERPVSRCLLFIRGEFWRSHYSDAPPAALPSEKPQPQGPTCAGEDT